MLHNVRQHNRFITQGSYIGYMLEVCHPCCVCENWRGYVVKHNYVH